MSARSAQLGAAQGADEERKGDVPDSTASASRSQQRSNASKSTGGVDGLASEQGSAVRGLVAQYEIAVLYHPDLEIDLEKASAKVQKIFTDNGGKIEKTDNWGKRKLAYPIIKQDHALYVFYTVELPSEGVQKIESTLNITAEVIRFLITKPDLKAIVRAEAAKADKAKKAAKRGDTASNDEEKDDEAREQE